MGLLRCLVLSALVGGTGCRQVLGLDDVDCTPSYAAPVDYATAAGPRAVGVGDLGGDGHPDLVTANTGNANVSRFDGVGDGTVMPKTDHEAIAAPVDMVVGDVSGDGLADVAVLGNNGGLVVLRGDGAGITRDPAYNVDNGRDLEIGDLDRNGVLDLVGTSNGTTLPSAPAKLSILLAQSDGSLALTQYDAPDNPNQIRIADFTGDGRLDLLLTSHDEIPTVILPGNGDGTFGDAIATGFQLTTNNIVVGDVNGDGRPDLVVTNASTAIMTSVALGNGDGTFMPGTATADEIVPTALADVDADGALDIVGIGVAGQDGKGTIGVRLGVGDGTFGTLTTTTLNAQAVDAIAAKLDGDSIPELIAVLGATNNIAIIDGRCTFAE